MKIRVHTMGGTQHSWTGVMHDYVRGMKEIGGHEIYFKSTNNLDKFPDDLKDLLLPGYHGHLAQGPADFLTPEGKIIKVDPSKPAPQIPDNHKPYDLELAYTIFFQGPRRFFIDSKCRAVIWNFESSILPPGWHLYAKSLDYILPSSQYSLDIFADNGIPKDKMIVVPHGVDTRIFNPDIPPFKLKTEKKVKFLHCARPHHRKLHNRVIKGYLDAFTGDDDVCLVLKTEFLTPDKDKIFEVDVKAILEKEIKGRGNPPEIEVVNTYIPHIGSLYTACDAVVSMSSCEGFQLPALESMACGKIMIAPRHGGQLEFLNDSNSLLVDTGIMKAPANMQYWVANPDAVVGDPDIKHYKELLRKVYENLEEEKAKLKDSMEATVKKFNWKDASQKILDLPIPKKSKRINEKRKVLYIVPYNMVGGGEIWVHGAIKQLDRNVYDPEVALVSGTEKTFYSKLESLDVKIYDLSKQGTGHALKCLLESGNYDIVHFYNSFAVYNILLQAWRQGFRSRVVETVHSELKWKDSMTKVAARDKSISLMISVSNSLARKLLQGGNKNVVTMPQLIDWDRFKKVKRDKKILTQFNIPTENFTVGFVGRISPEKNIALVLHCAKVLPEISFVIVGDGPQKAPLQQMGAALKNVFFVGPHQNTEDFYASFDVLILPSKIEGLPLVILEAMATGTPAIASDVGAISEIINDGINGMVVWNPNNPSLFADNIKSLSLNKKTWEQFSKNSRSVAEAMRLKSEHVNINTIYNLLFPTRKS